MMDTAETVSTTSYAAQEADFALTVTPQVILWDNCSSCNISIVFISRTTTSPTLTVNLGMDLQTRAKCPVLLPFRQVTLCAGKSASFARWTDEPYLKQHWSRCCSGLGRVIIPYFVFK